MIRLGWYLIPTQGIYILIIELQAFVCIDVGLLGYKCFAKGLYGYIGSAKGLGGIEARIRHHMTKAKRRLWWHIDYLTVLKETMVKCAVYAETLDVVEEDIVSIILESNCWDVAIPRFGSTDRKSISHLLKCTCSYDDCVSEAASAFIKLGLTPHTIEVKKDCSGVKNCGEMG